MNAWKGPWLRLYRRFVAVNPSSAVRFTLACMAALSVSAIVASINYGDAAAVLVSAVSTVALVVSRPGVEEQRAQVQHAKLAARVAAVQHQLQQVRSRIAYLVNLEPGGSLHAALNGESGSPEQRDELWSLTLMDASLSVQLRELRDELAAARIAQSAAKRRRAVRVRPARWRRALGAVKLSAGLTSLALALAGRRREESRVQWRDQLEGAPEDGIIVTPAMRVRYSLGFLVAALHYRLSDMAAPGWRVIDWLLSTHSRTNSFVALVVGGQAIYITWVHGLDILLTEGSAWLLATGASIVGVAVWLRKNRGIDPPDARQPAE